MAISQITSKSITDSTITSDDIATGAVESSMTTQIGGRRNLIINGAVTISQRGSDINNVDNGGYTADRFNLTKNNLDQLAIDYDQVADAPEGFSNSLKLTVATPETDLNANEFVRFNQPVEAQDLQHLKYGTANAKSVTLSFWVKSSITGTYAQYLYSQDGNRIIGSTYTINSANTWEHKTITYAGDTGGTINNDNGLGLNVSWLLSAGSDYTSTDNTSWGAYSGAKIAYNQTADVITQSGATWQITGVQLEVGTVATPFEHRSYGEELLACQRYLNIMRQNGSDSNIRYCSGVCASATAGEMAYVIYPELRSTPALSVAAAANYRVRSDGARTCTSVGSDNRHKNGANIQTTVSGGQTSGFGANLDATSSSSFIELDAEL